MRFSILTGILAILIVISAYWLVNYHLAVRPIDQPITPEKVDDEHTGPAAAKAPGDNETIRLGVIAAGTGSASGVNSALFPAVRIAVDELNQSGGLLGRQVTVIELDNHSTSLGTVSAARKAVDSRVVAVIGCVRSSFSMAAAPILQEARIPMISPVSTNPEVTRLGNYIFRVCFVDSFQGELLALFARRDLNAHTAAVFVNANRIYSIELADIFSDTFVKLGGEQVWYGEYLDNAADYTELIDAVKPLQPDVIFIPGEERDSGYIIRQARERGVVAQFIGPDSWSIRIYHYAGDHAENAFFTTHWHPQVDIPASRVFVEKYGDQPEMMQRMAYPLGYDAVMLFADAVRRCASTESSALRDAIHATADFQGVTGRINFNEYGDPIGKPVVILKLAGGKTEFVTRIDPDNGLIDRE